MELQFIEKVTMMKRDKCVRCSRSLVLIVGVMNAVQVHFHLLTECAQQ